MTEKQKMLMGILYNAEDQALIEERNHAKSLTRQFNEHWEDKGRRNYLIGQIFGSLGKNVHLEAPIYLDYGYRTTIGSDFFSNFNLTILDGGGVEIGNHVFIGPIRKPKQINSYPHYLDTSSTFTMERSQERHQMAE